MASLRQIEACLNKSGGMSGEVVCLSCQSEQAERDQTESEQAERHRHCAQFHALHLFERKNDRADEKYEKHQARRIESGAAAVALARRNAQHEHEGEESERNIDEEDRLPAQRLGEIAAGDGTEVLELTATPAR